MINSSSRPPLWKQVLGAIAGAALALVLYGAYETASPRLTAYFLEDVTTREIALQGLRPSRRVLRDDTAEQFRRIAERARQAAVQSPSNEPLSSSIEEVKESLPQDVIPQDQIPVRAQERILGGSEIHTRSEQKLASTKLPSSGVGLWFGAFTALALTGLAQRKRLALLALGAK